LRKTKAILGLLEKELRPKAEMGWFSQSSKNTANQPTARQNFSHPQASESNGHGGNASTDDSPQSAVPIPSRCGSNAKVIFTAALGQIGKLFSYSS
jgi:hypothetical protein